MQRCKSIDDKYEFIHFTKNNDIQLSKEKREFLFKKVKKQYANIFLNTKVTKMSALKKGIKVDFEGKDSPSTDTFDKVLVAVGRKPYTEGLNLSKVGVKLDNKGRIEVNNKLQTSVKNIYAIGDCGDRVIHFRNADQANIRGSKSRIC